MAGVSQLVGAATLAKFSVVSNTFKFDHNFSFSFTTAAGPLQIHVHLNIVSVKHFEFFCIFYYCVASRLQAVRVPPKNLQTFKKTWDCVRKTSELSCDKMRTNSTMRTTSTLLQQTYAYRTSIIVLPFQYFSFTTLRARQRVRWTPQRRPHARFATAKISVYVKHFHIFRFLLKTATGQRQWPSHARFPVPYSGLFCTSADRRARSESTKHSGF